MTAATPNLEAAASGRPAAGRRSVDPRGVSVRSIRWLDRRGGLSSRRAERAYARCARLFHGLHTRVVQEAVAQIGTRGVLVEFDEDRDRFLAPDYVPSM